MKTRPPKDDGQPRESDLYRQFLLKRRSQPIGIISVLNKYVWFGLILVPALAAQNIFLSNVAMTAVFFMPLVVCLAVLLWFLPSTFNRDIATGVLHQVFVPPVKTVNIVTSLRLFFGYYSLKLLFPCILVYILYILAMVFGLPDNALEGSSWFIKFALVWWLLLESSIAVTSCFRAIVLTQVLIVVFVVPILLAIHFTGTWVSNLLWEACHCDDLVQAYISSKWMLIHMNSIALPAKMHSFVTNTIQGLFLLVPISLLYFGNPRLMQAIRFQGLASNPPGATDS